MLDKALRLQKVSDRISSEIQIEEEKYLKLKYTLDNITPNSDISTPSLALLREQLIIMEKFITILKQRRVQILDEITQLEKK